MPNAASASTGNCAMGTPISGRSGFGRTSVKGRKRFPRPAAISIAARGGPLEIVVMEKHLAQLRIPRVLQKISADILERVPDELEIGRVAAAVEEGGEASDRLEVPLHRHEIEDVTEMSP